MDDPLRPPGQLSLGQQPHVVLDPFDAMVAAGHTYALAQKAYVASVTTTTSLLSSFGVKSFTEYLDKIERQAYANCLGQYEAWEATRKSPNPDPFAGVGMWSE